MSTKFEVKSLKIALLSINHVDEETLKSLQYRLSKVFPKTECVILEKEMSLPNEAFDATRQQYHSSIILSKIHKYVKETEANHVLGVTEADLFVPRLNFIFGEAESPGKVAVISLHRLHPEFYVQQPNRDLFLQRCLKEAVHEIGHMIGLGHCRNPNCVMFFSNSILDTDRKESSFCEHCYQHVLKRVK
jgi:archaemetzincin